MPPKKAATAGGVPARKKSAKNAYQMPEPVPKGSVLSDLSKQQWLIGPSIGTGGFGEIYSACKAAEPKKKTEDYQFVVKIEPHNNGPLFVEMHFYMRNAKLDEIEKFRKSQRLASLGMPHFVASGSHELNAIKHRFVVMPRYGQDIAKLWVAGGRRLPAHTACRLAWQMLDVLEYIHQCTYVHADLKGANMLLGLGKGGAAQAYLVDFGLACHYTTNAEFKPDPKKMHNGTIEYTSRDAHCGVPTRRGDMEILAYNLVHWWGGAQFPWEAGRMLEQPAKVHEAKKEFMGQVEKALREAFGEAGCPAPILQFFQYVNTLQFNSAPDYSKCRRIFESALKSMGKPNSGDLDFKHSATSASKSAVPPPAAATPKKPAAAARKPAAAKTAAAAKASASSGSDDLRSPPPAKKTAARKPPTPRVATPKRAAATKRSVVAALSASDHESRDSSPEVLPAKKQRGMRSGSEAPHEKENAAQNGLASDHHGGGSMTINNGCQSKRATKKKDKTYEFNFELDVSLDANVVINVKRKARGESKTKETEKKKATTPLQKVLSGSVAKAAAAAAAAAAKAANPVSVKSEPLESDDDDEIEASPDVTPVASVRRLQKDDSRRRAHNGATPTSVRK